MHSSSEKEARSIMATARQHICRHYNIFMDAVYNVQPQADCTLPSPMISNGIYLYYHPDLICILHQIEGIEAVAYGIMHICAHCLLGHLPARHSVKSKELYDVLADYKVDKMLSVLCPHKKYSNAVRNLPSMVNFNFAHHPLPGAYNHLQKNKKDAEKYLKYAFHFMIDDHNLWYRPEKEEENQGNSEKNGQNDSEIKNQSLQYVVDKKWKEIKEKMNEGNPLLSHCCGDSFDSEMPESISEYDLDLKSTTDYKDILEQFLRNSTVELENPEVIDPVWYHYGLDYLQDVPLIEPLDEMELPNNGTLLIAIDTSGSCEGELCYRFLGELDKMMKDLQTMGSLNQVVLFQCDSEIHEELVMHSPDEWNTMMDTFELKGGGWTNFCPVFEEGEKYHDALGLIYLSDAAGAFPKSPPPYPTLFLLTEDEDGHCGSVPSWVQEVHF